MHRETRKMIEKVEDVTGCRVSIGSDAGFTGFAQMMAASPRNPVHIITINQKYAHMGDYIVALQCAMLLNKWSDPTRIPVFTTDNAKVDELIEKTAKDAKLAEFDAGKSLDFSAFMVRGLFQQLVSVPSQMLSMDICRQECPGLVDMMETAANIEIKECHQSLEPAIRRITPDTVFQPNAAMNAAFAVYWSRISGTGHILLPFVAADALHKGKELLTIFDDISATGAQKYVRTVDAWALKLNLNSVYQWEYTEI